MTSLTTKYRPKTSDPLSSGTKLPAQTNVSPEPNHPVSARDQSSLPARPHSEPNQSAPVENQAVSISHTGCETHEQLADAGALLDPFLAVQAEILSDLEASRIANENRLYQLREAGLSGKKIEQVESLVAGLKAIEERAAKDLARTLRTHPLGPWVRRQCGLGDKQVARLLAAIGDPYWHNNENRPRTVSELWAYCGLHVLRSGQRIVDDQSTVAAADQTGDTDGQKSGDAQTSSAVGVAPARRKGQRANWSGDARMRCYLIAVSCVKQLDSPYREVYDAGRAKYADSIHPAPCVRCGPSGKPAATGSPLSAAHQHARAMRLMSKAVLKDLWVESKRLHDARA